jgi:hypothetical protein
MRTGLTKSQKITEICFDEKEPLIYIRTHNTDLKNRLTAYAAAHPGECRQTDADPDTGCMEFEIRKGRFSFRLTAPYSEERRRAASEAAKKHSGNLTHNIQKICYNFLKSATNAPQKVLIRVKGLLIQRKGDEGFGRCENY